MRKLAIIAGVLALMAGHAWADEPNVDTGGGFGTGAVTLLSITSTGSASSPVSSSDQNNMYWRGTACMLQHTAILGSTLSTITVQGKDQTSGLYYNIATSGQISTATAGLATTSTLVTAYPGLTSGSASGPAGSSQQGLLLPKVWRVQVGIANGTTITANVGCSLVR